MYEASLKKELSSIKEKLSQEDKPLAVQLPEGLKKHSLYVLDYLKDHDPVLFIDPVFGACDVKDEEAKKMGCKALIHFGHEKMLSPVLKTFFVPLTYDFSKEDLSFIIEEIKKLKKEKINLVTTTNFLENISLIKKELNASGIKILETKETSRVKKHMVLGCDSSTIIDKEKPIVFVGDGEFHPNNIGFVFKDSEIYAINPIQRISKKLVLNDVFIKQRYALITKAKLSNSFGIFVSTKKGQFRLNLAKKLKKKIESLGKKAYIFVCDYINEEHVEGVSIDCYVNTACPRISYDDHINFKKPIISAQEVLLLDNTNQDLKIDQIID